MHGRFTMIDLTTGAGVAYNADWRHNSASTIKGPYVVALNKLWPWELANSESDMFTTLNVSSNFTYANLCNRYGHFPLDTWLAKWALADSLGMAITVITALKTSAKCGLTWQTTSSMAARTPNGCKTLWATTLISPHAALCPGPDRRFMRNQDG